MTDPSKSDNPITEEARPSAKEACPIQSLIIQGEITPASVGGKPESTVNSGVGHPVIVQCTGVELLIPQAFVQVDAWTEINTRLIESLSLARSKYGTIALQLGMIDGKTVSVEWGYAIHVLTVMQRRTFQALYEKCILENRLPGELKSPLEEEESWV